MYIYVTIYRKRAHLPQKMILSYDKKYAPESGFVQILKSTVHTSRMLFLPSRTRASVVHASWPPWCRFSPVLYA